MRCRKAKVYRRNDITDVGGGNLYIRNRKQQQYARARGRRRPRSIIIVLQADNSFNNNKLSLSARKTQTADRRGGGSRSWFGGPCARFRAEQYHENRFR